MSEAAKPQHTYTGPPVVFLPEHSAAERVKTLFRWVQWLRFARFRKVPGFPFGSLMPYALDEVGRPLFLISAMAMHTQNLKADARASLFAGRRGRRTILWVRLALRWWV